LLEYKILAQSDSFWKDRFSPQLLESALNELARKGWRVVTCTNSEFSGLGGLGTKRHELFVLLEREVEETQPAPVERRVEDFLPYDASLIPAERFYKDMGSISTILQNSGHVSKDDMNRARAETAARGGHLADHLLALGLIDPATLRAALTGK
jgi:hypothetical protein